jgi:hypothetical protein
VQQIFVRDGEGKVYGPLEPVTVELLIDGGVLNGTLLVSTDGVEYGAPAHFPALRDYFPRHLWGEAPPGSSHASTVLAAAPAPATSDGAAAPASSAAPGASPSAASPPAAAPPPARAATEPGRPFPRVTAAVPTPAALEPVAPKAARPGAAAARAAPSPTGSGPVVPAIPPIAPAAKKTPTGSFDMAPPRPTPAAGSPTVPSDARLEAAGATRPAGSAAPPPSPMPVPPRTTTPRTAAAAATAAPGSSYSVASGDLAEISAIRLYVQAVETDVTGLFTFQLGDRSILVHFRKGNPDFTDSTHPEDAVEPFLLHGGLVTPEQLRAAEKEKGRFGGEVLGTLFALGLVNPGLVFPALAQRATSLLLRAFLSPAGIFQFQPLELPTSKVLPLGSRWSFLVEVLRRFPLAELKRRMMDVRQRPLVRRGSNSSLPDLRFTAQEMRALGYFDGTKSLAILAQSHAGEMETILRVALLLRELDALSFPDIELRGGAAATGEHPAVTASGQRAPSEPPRPVVPPPAAAAAASAPPPRFSPTPPPARAPRTVAPQPSTPTPAPVSAPRTVFAAPTPIPGAPVDYESEIRALLTRLEKGKSLNHFQLLGLSDKADAAQVKAAYFKLAKLYHPDTVPPGGPPELAQLKAQVFAMVGEASRVLGDEQSRADYLESLRVGGGSAVDVRQVLAAEETFHKGVAFVKARRFPEAVKTLDDAITLNPREGEFYAWRGYARFFTTLDKKVGLVDAMRDLHNALKLNERCAPAHYLIGQLHKLTGDNTLAMKHFKKCVNLDSSHVDAQREIRLLTGR